MRTEEEMRREVIAYIEATYHPPLDGWLRVFFIQEANRATGRELLDMYNKVRSFQNAAPRG